MQCLRSIRGFALGLAAFAALGTVGCGGEADDDAETIQAAITVENALTANALTANALTANALTANALTANALTANALTANALTANGLRDPLAREFLKYVVSCALDEDDSVVVQDRRQALRVSRRAGSGAGVGPVARLVRRRLPALGLGLRARARRRGGRQADDLDPRRQPRAAPGGQRAAPLHATARRRISATCSSATSRATCACRRARPTTSACAAIRSTTAR